MVSGEHTPNLTEILDAKRNHLAERKRKTPIDAVRALASMQQRPVPFLNTVTVGEPVLLIGQIRYAPPVEAPDADGYDPVGQAVQLARAGVDAVALFTDDTVYSGGTDDLMFIVRAVQAFNVPVITQDYIFDEYQVVEARAAGASALVITASVVEPAVLRTLISSTQRNRMTAIVRVTNETELQQALAFSPQVIAISSPNAASPLSPAHVQPLRALIPAHTRVAVVGGVSRIDEAQALVRLGIHALFLNAPFLSGMHLPMLRSALVQPSS